MSCVVENLDYISMDVWCLRVTGIRPQKIPCWSLKCQYLMSGLVCGVLCVARIIFFPPLKLWTHQYVTPFQLRRTCVMYDWYDQKKTIQWCVLVVCDVKNVTGCFRMKKEHMLFCSQQYSAAAHISNSSTHCMIWGFCHDMNEIIVALGHCTVLNNSNCCALN